MVFCKLVDGVRVVYGTGTGQKYTSPCRRSLLWKQDISIPHDVGEFVKWRGINIPHHVGGVCYGSRT